jgi:hypothetical protein
MWSNRRFLGCQFYVDRLLQCRVKRLRSVYDKNVIYASLRCWLPAATLALIDDTRVDACVNEVLLQSTSTTIQSTLDFRMSSINSALGKIHIIRKGQLNCPTGLNTSAAD